MKFGKPVTQVLVFIAALTGIRLWIASQVELQSVEAYYWLYGRHPALGYFDHPAMIGWMVWLSTALFGHGPVGVRLFTIAGGALTVWLTFLAGRRLFDERAGRLAALLVGLVPLGFAYGGLATPDAPLLLFWTAAVWALAHALSGGRPVWWCAAGAFLGAAMLSKYHGFFLALGVLFFLLLSPDHRGWLKRPHPYLGAMIALAVFSPTLLWNAQEGWRSLLYQGTERFELGRGLSLRYPARFISSQLLLVTPFTLIWACAAGGRALVGWRMAAWQARLLVSIGMPLLLLFGILMFFRPVRGHWAAPAYVSLLLLMAGGLGRMGWRLQGGTAAFLGVGYVALAATLTLAPGEWRTGWAQLAEEVGRRRPDFVLARDYHDASQLAYHLRPLRGADFTAVGRPSKAFLDWWRGEAVRGASAVVVWEAKDWPEGLDLVQSRFESVGREERVEVARWNGRKQEYVIVVARGYKP